MVAIEESDKIIPSPGQADDIDGSYENGDRADPLTVYGIGVEPVGDLVRMQFRSKDGELIQGISLAPQHAGQLALAMAGIADAMIQRMQATAQLVGPGGRILTGANDGN